MITWINCSERMPPDDETEIIVQANGYHTVHEGSDLKAWLSTNHVQWCDYTEEAWSELTR